MKLLGSTMFLMTSQEILKESKRDVPCISATHILRICLCISFYCSQIFELILDHSDSLQIIDIKVSTATLMELPSFHPYFIHLLHCSSDFLLTKTYPFQPGMKSHSLAIVVPCRHQKLETFPTFPTPRFGVNMGEPNRLSTRRELQSSLPVKAVGFDHQIQDVTCEINPIPPKRFASNFGR